MASYKLKQFSKFAQKQNLTRNKLLKVIYNAQNGLCYPLGGEVYKERVIGKGNRVNVRVIFAFRIGAHSFFLDGFLKSHKTNLTKNELQVAKILAAHHLNLDNTQLQQLVANNQIVKV